MITGITPELRLGDVPNLCSYGPRPRLMTGLIVQLLRQQFAAASLIEEPGLRGDSPMVWGSDPLTAGLNIEAATVWVPEESMERPALIVRRDEWHFERMGIGNRLMGTVDLEDGSEYFSQFVMGSHTIFALASDPDDTEDLGTEVYRQFGQFATIISEAFDLKRFAIASMGVLGRLPEVAEAYAVPVTVAYAFEDTWKVTLQAPAIKRITVESIITGA
jgi:hypothetical protein